MPNLKKIQRQFFNDIFDSKSEIELTTEMSSLISELIPGLDVNALGTIKLSEVIKSYIYRVQFMIIDQDKETLEHITNFALDKIIHFLKFLFDHLHPNIETKNDEEYWQYVRQSLNDCIVLDFDASKLKILWKA